MQVIFESKLLFDIRIYERLYDHLNMIKKDEKWLKKELKNKRIEDISKIIYAGVTNEDKLEIVLMNNLEAK